MNQSLIYLRYGLFACPAAISLLAMQVYMPTFLVETGLYSFAEVGFVFFVARLIDTITDPLIGYLSDHTPAKYGQRRAWVLAGLPAFLLVFYLVINPSGSVTYLFALISAWYIFGTCLMVPYYAWSAEIQHHTYAYSKFAAVRAGFGLTGTLMALTIPVLMADERTTSAYIENSYYLATLLFLIALPMLASLPDRRTKTNASASVREILSLFKRGSDFNRLMISQLVNGTANALPATLFILFATHVLDNANLVGPLLLVYFVTAAVAIPFWMQASKAYSKKKCWQIAMVIAAAVFSLTVFVSPDTIWLFTLITFTTGLMAGADLSLPAAMLADQIDVNAEKTGRRKPGLHFAVWGTTTKLTLALAIGFSFPLIGSSGITGTQASIASVNETLLVFLYAGLPAGLKLLSVWLLRHYTPRTINLSAGTSSSQQRQNQ